MNLIILMITLALAQFDFVKELSVAHESYHSDDYLTEHFVFFLPPVARPDMTSILYSLFSALWSVSIIVTNQCTQLSLAA
jgi:hypothetical protein